MASDLSQLSLAELTALIANTQPAISKTQLYPTHPGTSLQDYSKPGWPLQPERNGNTSVYRTHPGTTLRDYRQPGYVIKDQ